jgi:tetratricopeptide (TPR) repeat protein
MSALFGKKNYGEIFERLVRSGSIDLALREAIKNGDTLYELGNIDEAIFNYSTLLGIFKKNNVPKHEVYERIYEKLAPLYLESGNSKKGIETTLALIDKKIILKKAGEAVKLLKALESNFFNDSALMLKITEVYVNLGFFSEAFEIVDKLIKKDSTNVDLLKMGGELLYKLGRFEESYTYFSAIIMLAPEDEFAKSRLDVLKSQQVKEETEETVKSMETPLKEVTSTSENVSVLKKLEIPVEAHGEETRKLTEETPTSAEKKEMPGAGEPGKSEETKKTVRPVLSETSKGATGIKEILHADPEYLEALESIKNGDERKGVELLKKAASRFENINSEISEYIYDKVLIFDPEDTEVKLKLAGIYKEKKEIEDCIFYLRSALKSSKRVEKLQVLKELISLLPEDMGIKTEIFSSLIELKEFDDAFEIFFKLSDKNAIETFALKVLPYLKENVQSLGRVARFLRGKGISNMLSHQYFYLFGKALFNMGENVEGIRWLISAHRIAKLPLDDYVMIAQYIKTLPLEGEKDIVGDAILGYTESIEDLDKKARLLRLVLELKPEKVSYLVSYLDMLIKTENIGKETNNVLLRLVKMKPVNYADFVYNVTLKLVDSLNAEELNSIATFFDVLDKKDEATKIYSIIMNKDPGNKNVLIKFFIMHIEGESLNEIMRFFDQFLPSHSYLSLVEPFINKYKGRQSKEPFDYHVHFVLGFLYFLTERYEEAVASFQFVVRSHQFEAFMHYFLGICFEKILLEDFAMTQYKMAIKTEGNLAEVKLSALYRLSVLYRALGKINEYRDTLSEIVSINPDFKDTRILFESLPPEEKIIDLNKEEFK